MLTSGEATQDGVRTLGRFYGADEVEYLIIFLWAWRVVRRVGVCFDVSDRPLSIWWETGR